jgi:hypothetical protein
MQPLCRIGEQDRIGLGCRARGCGGQWFDLCSGQILVRRHLKQGGLVSPGMAMGKSGVEQRRNLTRVISALGPIDHAPAHRQLVLDLMGDAVILANMLRRDLPGDPEHRLVRRVSGDHRRHRVQQPRPGHDRKHPGAPSRLGIAHRHERRALLVPRVHHLQIVPALVKRVIKRVELNSGNAEDGIDAIVDQRADDGLAASHDGHDETPW